MSLDKRPDLADTLSCPPFLNEAGTETLPGGTRVFTDDVHRIGTDALLLAGFAAESLKLGKLPRSGNSGADGPGGPSVIDLGSGCGVLVLSLIDAGLPGPAVGIELDPAGAALLERANAENGFQNLSVIQGDFRAYRTPRPFDLVVSNPPYYNAGAKSPHPARALARHGESCSVVEVCAAAGRLLKDRGRFCLCWPPARLVDAFSALRAANLEPKRMQLVRKGTDAPPWLALIEARKDGGVELKILPDRILPPGQALSN